MVRSVLLSMILLVTPALGQVESFHEVFDGNGEFESNPAWGIYSGLHNPGWRIGLVDGEQTAKGLASRNVSTEPDIEGFRMSTILREKSGRGSFVERIVVHDLELTGETERSVSKIGFRHFMGAYPQLGPSFGMTVVEVGPATDPWKWGASATTTVEDREIDFADQVAASLFADIALEIQYNDRSKSVFFAYDMDLTDDLPMIRRGPFQYHGPVHETTASTLFFEAGGDLAEANAVITEWSLRAVDDFDYSMDGALDSTDIDLLATAVRREVNEALYDINDDQIVDHDDLSIWVHNMKNTYFGDANLDGEFSSSDLVLVFGVGQYEDGISGNSAWATGDWNADGEFDTGDLVTAFRDGGFELGPRAALIPEPTTPALLAWLAAVICIGRQP